METIDLICDNKYISKTLDESSSDIIIFSLPNIKTNLDDYVRGFINVRSFPYVNTEYGSLLDESLNELDQATKIEVNEILLKYWNEITNALEEKMKDTNEFSSLSDEEKADLLGSVKGGQYAEMLLMNILIDIGYQKILSKLYLEIGEGRPTPTLIDVPCLNGKSLVLGECKLYANIDEAIESVVNDIKDIIEEDKLDNEIKEWKKKFKQVPEKVRNSLMTLGVLEEKDIFVNNFDEIVVVGFVMGKKDNPKIEKQLAKHPLPSVGNLKFKVYLIMIPIDDKKSFLLSCSKAIKEIIDIL